MNIKGKILEIEKEQSALNQKLELLKVEYKEYIVNKEIPVLERWSFFINAPSTLKENSEWIISSKNAFLKYIMDNKFDAPEVYGRGKTIYIEELFDDLIHDEGFNKEDYYYKKFSETVIKKGLEELLEMNLESFCLDW